MVLNCNELDWTNQTPSGVVKTTEKDNSLFTNRKGFPPFKFKAKVLWVERCTKVISYGTVGLSNFLVASQPFFNMGSSVSQNMDNNLMNISYSIIFWISEECYKWLFISGFGVEKRVKAMTELFSTRRIWFVMIPARATFRLCKVLLKMTFIRENTVKKESIV